LIGCVDNPHGRHELARTLETDGYAKPVWWLDLGNSAASGQVFLGNVLTPKACVAPSIRKPMSARHCLRYVHVDPHDVANLMTVRTEKLLRRTRAA
jgi:hypothetical protein